MGVGVGMLVAVAVSCRDGARGQRDRRAGRRCGNILRDSNVAGQRGHDQQAAAEQRR